MKVRIDYLQVAEWTDFKSYDNSRRKVLLQALVDQFRYNRHYIQAAVYREAVEMLRANALPIIGEANDEQRRIVAAIGIRPEELDCWFVYQEKNGIPNILARRCRFFDVPLNVRVQHAGASEAGIARVEEATRTEQMWFARALGEVEGARQSYINYHEIYSRGGAWLPVNATGEFSDADFPLKWLEREY